MKLATNIHHVNMVLPKRLTRSEVKGERHMCICERVDVKTQMRAFFLFSSISSIEYIHEVAASIYTVVEQIAANIRNVIDRSEVT